MGVMWGGGRGGTEWAEPISQRSAWGRASASPILVEGSGGWGGGQGVCVGWGGGRSVRLQQSSSE